MDIKTIVHIVILILAIINLIFSFLVEDKKDKQFHLMVLNIYIAASFVLSGLS